VHLVGFRYYKMDETQHNIISVGLAEVQVFVQ